MSGSGAAKLEALRKAIHQAQMGNLRATLLKVAATEAQTQVSLGFRNSEAPDGMPWAPLKYRKGMPLRKTGKLANSVRTIATGSGFKISIGAPYAIFHQNGTNGRAKAATMIRGRKGGKLLSHKQVAKMLRSKNKEGAAEGLSIGTVHFAAGSGGIPARPMVPTTEALPEKWARALEKAVDAAFRAFWKKAIG